MILTTSKRKLLQVCKLGDNRGFTLIEILVAMIVLSIGLLGVAALTGGIMSGNSFSSQLTTATTLGQDKMEEIMRLGYSGMPLVDTEDAVTDNYNCIAGYPSYRRVIKTDVNSPAAGMKKVTVTVFWDSDAHSIVLKTILAE